MGVVVRGGDIIVVRIRPTKEWRGEANELTVIGD